MTDTAIVSGKDAESPDKDVESPTSKDGTEEPRNKLKDLDKKAVKFAGYIFWGILFIAAVATTSVFVSRPKSPETLSEDFGSANTSAPSTSPAPTTAPTTAPPTLYPSSAPSTSAPTWDPNRRENPFSSSGEGEGIYSEHSYIVSYRIMTEGDYILSDNEEYILRIDDDGLKIKKHPDIGESINIEPGVKSVLIASDGRLVFYGDNNKFIRGQRKYCNPRGNVCEKSSMKLTDDGNLQILCSEKKIWQMDSDSWTDFGTDFGTELEAYGTCWLRSI